jgi:hypothetical protein
MYRKRVITFGGYPLRSAFWCPVPPAQLSPRHPNEPTTGRFIGWILIGHLQYRYLLIPPARTLAAHIVYSSLDRENG